MSQKKKKKGTDLNDKMNFGENFIRLIGFQGLDTVHGGSLGRFIEPSPC